MSLNGGNMGVTEHNKNEFTEMLELYKIAISARDLELKFFWKRSVFFATFVSAVFLAHNNIKTDDQFIKTILSVVGLFLSVAWTLANRGSKYWYESWESKVGAMDKVISAKLPFDLFGAWSRPQIKEPLFQARLQSVTKIAICISDFVAIFWAVLIANSLYLYNYTRLCLSQFEKILFAIIGTAIVCLPILLIIKLTKSSVSHTVITAWNKGETFAHDYNRGNDSK